MALVHCRESLDHYIAVLELKHLSINTVMTEILRHNNSKKSKTGPARRLGRMFKRYLL